MKFLLPILLSFNVGVNGAFTGHVVGGVEVPIIMYPHVAQIITTRQACGGSIISDRVILTAAHCLVKENGNLESSNGIMIFVGSDRMFKGEKYYSCKIMAHEKYNGNAAKYYLYDIGLILLRQNILFGRTVKKIEIAHNMNFRNVKSIFTLAGFGATTNLTPYTPSHTLKATRMYFVKTETCNESQSYAEVMTVPNHMFCMIGQGWTSDCYGDSGAGIIWRRFLVGIVATGRDSYCGSDTVPSMYTDVVYLRQWVMAKVSQLESTPIEECQITIKSLKKRAKAKRTLELVLEAD